MSAHTRTIRLDLSTTLYEPLEHYATALDIGVSDMVRHLIVRWAADNPIPEVDEAES